MRSFAKRITQILDMPKLAFRIWIILWVINILLIMNKVLFHIWYPIVIENSTFISLCNFIEKYPIIENSIIWVFYMLSGNLFYLAYTKKLIYETRFGGLCVSALIFVGYILKNISNIYGILLEILIIIIAIIYNLYCRTYCKKWLSVCMPIIIYLILNLWQFNTYIIRGINTTFILDDFPFAISLILQLDYYIFLFITLIGVYYIMGTWGFGWLWGKSKTELLAIRKEELAKVTPNKKLIEEIDKAVAELEKQEREA